MNPKSLSFLPLLPFTLAAPLHAATISGTQSVLTGGGAAFDISDLGTSDWAYWDSSSYTAGAPTNEKLNGTLISTATPLGGGSLQGSGSTTTKPDFTFTDGTMPAMGSADNMVSIFNNQLDDAGLTAMAGVGLSITLPTADTYMVSIWTGIFDGTGTFIASLPGATAYTETGDGGAFEPKFGHLYTLTVSPDAPGATLTIDYRLTANGTASSSSHVLLSAAAVSVVPEPTSVALLSLGGLLALRRRR